MSAKPPGRIPFESIASAKSWSLPEVNGTVINGDEQRKRKVQAGKNKSLQSKRAAPERPTVSEDVEELESENVKGITAQQLEEITQAAEQDGFDKGYAEGLDQGKLDGRKAGYSEGIKAGTEQAESEHGQWLKEQGQHLQSLCESLFSPLENQQKALADTTLDLALGLAKHILQQELQLDSRKIIAVVDRALEALPPVEKNIVLYLHPEDASAYRDYAPQVIAPDAIHDDATLERGSCRVKSEHSYVDYSVATRLDEFIAALAEKPFDDLAAEAAIQSHAREMPEQLIEAELEAAAGEDAIIPLVETPVEGDVAQEALEVDASAEEETEADQAPELLVAEVDEVELDEVEDVVEAEEKLKPDNLGSEGDEADKDD